jgi:catechol-2,3-dioxygenase
LEAGVNGRIRFGHIGMHAKDPAALAGFYADFLGLCETARIETEEAGRLVMLTSRPGETFQELTFLDKPDARHVAFQMESLADLRELYARAREWQLTVLLSLDHGTQISFYFLDPEGNALEAFWETGRFRDGGNRPIDLTRPESEILELIAI